MHSRTFTQFNHCRGRIFTAIQSGTIGPRSEAFRELAEISIELEDAPIKPVVIARLTITRANGKRTIVEIHQGATFHSFFHYYIQEGNRRSTKKHLRTAARNEGGLRTSGLEAIALRLSVYQNQSNPVTGTTIRILRKRDYRKLLNARPDELGLTHTSIYLPFTRFNEARSS